MPRFDHKRQTCHELNELYEGAEYIINDAMQAIENVKEVGSVPTFNIINDLNSAINHLKDVKAIAGKHRKVLKCTGKE